MNSAPNRFERPGSSFRFRGCNCNSEDDVRKSDDERTKPIAKLTRSPNRVLEVVLHGDRNSPMMAR